MNDLQEFIRAIRHNEDAQIARIHGQQFAKARRACIDKAAKEVKTYRGIFKKKDKTC